jgi:hypothetical protein
MSPQRSEFLLVALVASVSIAVWFSQIAINQHVELVEVSGNQLLRSYSKETRMIDGPMDAEDGSLYNAPFR